jgi:hypothetical protein
MRGDISRRRWNSGAMTMNRLKHLFDREERPSPSDFYEVTLHRGGVFFVSRRTADLIGTQLDRLLTPRWITFDDLFGVTIRIRSRSILRITESTAAQREAEQRFRDLLATEIVGQLDETDDWMLEDDDEF